MKYLEIEYKYRANDISLSYFEEFCRNRKPERVVVASGYDYFYEDTKNADRFCRLRSGPDMHQLTFKNKTTEKNNVIRDEINGDLCRSMTKNDVEKLLAAFGYSYNTTIFKNCFVYNYDYYTLVYYICYDLDMKELGRFIEIEMKEDYDWHTQQEAVSELVALERLCKPLGISPQARIKKSLFELFRVENGS